VTGIRLPGLPRPSPDDAVRRPRQPDAIRPTPHGCALRRSEACRNRAAGVKANFPRAVRAVGHDAFRIEASEQTVVGDGDTETTQFRAAVLSAFAIPDVETPTVRGASAK
jgi:hypothetical protein